MSWSWFLCEREREYNSCKPKTLKTKCYKVLNLKQLRLELWRVCSFNCSFTCVGWCGGTIMTCGGQHHFGWTSFMTLALLAFCCTFTCVDDGVGPLSGDSNNLLYNKRWVKRHVRSHLCPRDHPIMVTTENNYNNLQE